MMQRNDAERIIYAKCREIVHVMKSYTDDPHLTIDIQLDYEDGEYVSARNAYYEHPFNGAINFAVWDKGGVE